MEFKSQICTTKEQSERLLALGLKKETADMHHYQYTDGGRWNIEARPSIAGYNNRLVPAWSLHRLIEMLPPGYREQIRVGTTDNPYEYMYQVIGRLVYVGEFNKKYLEE